jgi:hypothetical protein
VATIQWRFTQLYWNAQVLMPFVFDASVMGSWVLPDENYPEALTAREQLKDDEAFAPSLLWFESRSYCWRTSAVNGSRRRRRQRR